MEIKIISDTAQEFAGETYWLCGQYFQRKGRRLHREVWKYHNGIIPQGYHIHHKDGNPHNNDISNLEMKTCTAHLSDHQNHADKKAQSRESIKKARAFAKKWHGSKSGLLWHSEQGKENWKKRKENTYACSFCGKEYQTKYVYPASSNHFCGDNCRAKALRRRRRESKANRVCREG